MKNGLNENEFAVKITNLFMFFNAKNLYFSYVMPIYQLWEQ